MNNELIFNEIIENTLGTITLARVEAGELFNKKAEIWIKINEDEELYLSYVPYASEGVEIHGNTRIALAKEFIVRYKFNQLKELYNNKIEAENRQRASEEENKIKLENAIKELELNKFRDLAGDKIEVNFHHGIKKYYIEFSVKKDQLTGSNIQICNNGNYTDLIYKINYIEMPLNEFKTALNELYNISMSYYIQLQEEKQKALEKEMEEERKQKAIYDLYKNIADSIIILRTGKKNFIAFENGLRYSVGTGKSGKYYSCSYGQFKDMINKKDIKKLSYALLNKDAKTYQQDEFYLNLEYKNII